MNQSLAFGIAERIREAGQITASRLTARSGVSRMTQRRIDTGESEATLHTIRELAIAAGLDLAVNLVPLSDPDAAAGARSILDDTVTDADLTDSAITWATRLRRFAGQDLDPIDVVTEAGRATAPLQRVGAILLRGDWDDLKLASAATAARGTWVISGDPVLRRIASRDTGQVGAAIVYADDPTAVARYLTHLRPARPATANVAILPMAGILLVDSWEDGPLRLVAPVQAIIDSIGLGGVAADVALNIAKSW